MHARKEFGNQHHRFMFSNWGRRPFRLISNFFSFNFQNLQWLSLVMLVTSRFSHQEAIMSSTTAVPTIDQSQKSANQTNIFEMKGNANNTEDERHVNGSSDYSRSANKIQNVDLSTLHKYRRNGFENSPDTGSDDFKRYFHVPVFPHHPPPGNELTNDFRYNHYQPREKYPYNDEIYPVRIQTCGQYLRDVNRFQNDASSPIVNANMGVVAGWIGGKSRWRDRYVNDDKRYESTVPTYIPITTATAKIPASFHRYQENNNTPDRNSNNINNNIYNKASYVPVKSKVYNSEQQRMQDSREYSSEVRNRGYNNERNSPPYMQPTFRDRNNRIIYYEYNFDDLRRQKFGDSSSSYYPRDYERNCGVPEGEFIPCDPPDIRPYSGSKSTIRNSYDGPYNREYSEPYTSSAQSKSWSGPEGDEENSKLDQFLGHKHKTTDRGQPRQNSVNGYRGYVYSLDLPRNRQHVPGPPSSSIYTTHFPFAQNHFLNADNKYESSSRSLHLLSVNH
jgi:hypothetical protein